MRTTRDAWGGHRVSRLSALVCLLATTVVLTGCDEVLVVDSHCEGAHAPSGLYSVTGDGEVFLYWAPVQDADVDEFVIYRANDPEGVFYEIGHTSRDYFVDGNVTNGRTYFYGVTSVDHCGHESELSYQIAFDTPRPEGFGDRIHDANGDGWRRSAWEFDSYRAVPWDHSGADIYFVWADGVPFLVAVDLDTDIQDAGYAGFDDVDWAPVDGWSPTGTVEVIPGHVYVVWTRDNHFAKVRARALEGDSLIFDWAYQIDPGNPELGPRPSREPSPLSVSPGSRSLAASNHDADLLNTRITAAREES